MKALLLKDLLVIRKNISLVYLFPLLVILICGNGNPGFLVAMVASVVPLFFGFLLYGTFYSDENSHWLRMAKGMPLTTSQMVREKYVLSGLVLLFGVFVDLVVVCLIGTIFNVDMKFCLLMVLVGLLLGILYAICLIPAIILYGVSKGPIVFIACIGLLMAIPSIISFAGINVDFALLSDNLALLAVGLLLLFAALTFISLKISVRGWDDRFHSI